MPKILKKKLGAQEETELEIKTKGVISKFRHKEEEEATSAFAASINFPYLDTNLVPVSTETLKILTEAESRKYNAAIIHKVARTVSIVSTDPTKPVTSEFIEKLKQEKGWEIKTFVVSHTNMERIWERYKRIVFVDILDQMSLHLSGAELKKFEEEMKDLITLRARINEMPVTQILNIMMAGAYKLRASDVHIEPQEKEFRLRYRIDGVLQDVALLPLNVFKTITTRIKLMSGMKINLRDIAQDGTFEVKMETTDGTEKKIDTRVSIIPGNFGESAVIRLLDPESIKVSVEQLGIQGLAAELLMKQIEAPNGMILNTGPTGSGKTTTLYAIINKLNQPDKKIITIEDPIEYELPGIMQTQIEKSRGYTFGKGLRAIVRQDPDIILVGEIRDDETADVAVNSALTGHLVLSSLHTNNALGAIPRLIELGVKPSLISPSLNAAIGQRLVRKLCDCKEAYVPAKESVQSIKRILSIISPKAKVDIPKEIPQLYRPKGCLKCNNIGYKGRIGIFEVFTLTEETEKLVLDLAGETEMTMAALEAGMITMLQDGILKAVSGITSIDEVRRVTGQGEYLEEIYEKLMAATLGRAIVVSPEDYTKAKDNIKDFKKFQEVLKAAKVTEANQIIFAAAILLGVGDIHVEPSSVDVKIRFRIDGILQDVASIPLNEYPGFLGEIKVLSGVKTEVRQGVIDSRFIIKFDDEIKDTLRERSVDVRVSIILGGYGETVVMRLLSKANLEYDLTKLGIRKENLDKIMLEISKPNGVILNTGPTGSGKTTTLYSILEHLNNPEVKIITVEDPIEYQMDGILQTPVNDSGGYTFATALRQLLRQNPDIMMIGEIRDNETAIAAVQAALTGHLVLSTIHTNNAAGAVARMINMGVAPADIATAVNAFIAQRLVRRLCDCKKKVSPTAEEKAKMEGVLKTVSAKSGVAVPTIGDIYKPVGCEKCNGIGYKGRMTVSEVFQISRDIQEMITHGAITNDLQDKAVENGMLTMTQDGVIRVVEGETTLEEVERVTDL